MSLEKYARERFPELPHSRQMRAALRMAQFGDFAKSISVAESDLEIIDIALSYISSGFSSECSIVGTNKDGENSVLDMRWVPSVRNPPDFLKKAIEKSFMTNEITIKENTGDDKIYCAVPFVAYAGSEKHKMGALAMMRDSAFECTNSEIEILHMLPAIIGSNLGKYMLKEKTERDDGFPEAYSRSQFFNRELPQSLTDSKAGKESCLIYFDLDDFKKVNDNYGHNIGDQVLRQVISTVNAGTNLPTYRIGGEEFAVIVPGRLIEGQEVGDKVRTSIADYKYQFTLPAKREKPDISASVGVTQYRPIDTIETITSRADKALYAAKDEGKNQVVVLV